MIDGTYDHLNFFIDNTILVERDDNFFNHFDNVVFEGAQGLLLDELHPNFPYVTRSRTGIHNVNKILKGYPKINLDIYYVSRVYSTRHGAGPFPTEVTEMKDFPYIVDDPTNKPNEFQGTLRIGYLDVDILKDSIDKDMKNYTLGYPDKMRLVITCMDQACGDIVVKKDGKLVTIKPNDFGDWMKRATGIPVVLTDSAETPETIG
jgi:adenylosuccinate synthase